MKRLVAAVYDDLDHAERGVLTEVDGKGGTTFVGLNGTWYELDLTGEHAMELELALARFIRAAHKPTGIVKPPSTHATRANYAYNKAMRKFADESKGRYTYHSARDPVTGRVTTYKYSQKLRDAYAAHLAARAVTE